MSTTMTWEGHEYELVEPEDMTLGEGAACEKWHGVGQESWGSNQAILSMAWVTLKRRNPQFPRSRLEALTMRQANEMIREDPEPETHDDGQDGEGVERRADPTGPSADVP